MQRLTKQPEKNGNGKGNNITQSEKRVGTGAPLSATGVILPEPTIREQVDVIKESMLKSVEFMGLPGGVIHMRRQFARTFKGLENFVLWRAALTINQLVKPLRENK